MRHLPLLLLALVACKKSSPAPVENTVVDPAPTATKLEEVTPALITALADGKRSPRGLVDPAAGLYEMIIMPGGDDPGEPDVRARRCDRDAEQAIRQTMQAMKGAEVDNQEYGDYAIGCDADQDVAGAIRCASSGAAEWAPNYEVVFVADGAGAVHVAGILVWESGMNPEGVLAELAAAVQQPGEPCGQ